MFHSQKNRPIHHRFLVSLIVAILSLSTLAQASEKSYLFADKELQNKYERFIAGESNFPRRVLKAFYLSKMENNLDGCISDEEFNLYKMLWEVWDKQPKKLTNEQFKASLTYSFAQKNGTPMRKALIDLVDETGDNTDVLFRTYHIFRRKEWRDENGKFTFESLKKEREFWEAFKSFSENEVDDYIQQEVKISNGCTPKVISLNDSQEFEPLVQAKEVGETILKSADLDSFNLWEGMAGVAFFLAELHGVTKDDRYLDRASKLMGKIESIYNQKDAGPGGLIMGDAGIAITYLTLYLSSQKKHFLDRALHWGDAITLVEDATEHAFGAAGVGIVYLNFYQSTGDKKWLDKADEMAKLLDDKKLTSDEWDGYFWHMAGNDQNTFSGFGHGSAGIAYFLLKLYEVTKEKKLMDIALGAAEFTLSTAHIDSSGGMHWTFYQPMSFAFDFKYFWSHGSPGMLILYNELLKHFPVPKWKDAFERSLKTTFKYAIDAGGKGLISECCGRQSLAQIMLLIFERTGDKLWFDNAKKITSLVFDEKGRVPDINTTGFPVHASFSELSGLGIAFLRLHSPETVRHPFYTFPQKKPTPVTY